MTDTKRITTIVKALAQLWKRNPEKSFAQLFIDTVSIKMNFHQLRSLDDTNLFSAFEFALRDEKFKLRKPVINKKFKFTQKNVQRLDYLNKFFLQKENEAYKQAAELEEYALSKLKVRGTFVQDYEIEFHIALYTESKYFDEEELHERVDNTPFYEDTWGIHYVNKTTKNVKELKFREDWRKQNHNEFQHKVHPLKNQQHCYLFHHIYAHTLLAWEDIIRIEEISIDVVLSVQNNTTVNPDSKGNPVKKWKKPDYEIIHNDLPLKRK